MCFAYIPCMTAREHEKFSSSSKLPASPLLVTTGRQSAMTITWVSQLIDNVWKLRSFALEVKKTEARHTAENCAEELIDVSNRWEISSKLTTLGTDGARNMLAAARLLPF